MLVSKCTRIKCPSGLQSTSFTLEYNSIAYLHVSCDRALPPPASDLPTVKLRRRRERGLRLLAADNIHSLVINGIASVYGENRASEVVSVPAMNLKRVTPRCSATLVDLVAESTRTPSNKSSALLTEARHCITLRLA